jgi:hypothetical protein
MSSRNIAIIRRDKSFVNHKTRIICRYVTHFWDSTKYKCVLDMPYRHIDIVQIVFEDTWEPAYAGSLNYGDLTATAYYKLNLVTK